MSREGWIVGASGRRVDLLDSLQEEMPGKCFKARMDLTNVTEAVSALEGLIDSMDGVDIIVINSGVGSASPEFPLSDELQTVAVNVAGFTAMANAAYHYFSGRQGGHIVGMSSVASVRGGPAADYHASKAYVSRYLEGLACRSGSKKAGIAVTDIRPGFVETAMTEGADTFWQASVEEAARQMLRAIRKKRRVVYVTRRWRLIAFLMSSLPFGLYRRAISR